MVDYECDSQKELYKVNWEGRTTAASERMRVELRKVLAEPGRAENVRLAQKSLEELPENIEKLRAKLKMEKMMEETNAFGYSHKVKWQPKEKEACWAYAKPWFGLSDHPHWSRKFEYPWILAKGEFSPGMRVLDAAGGKGELAVKLSDRECEVTLVDLDMDSLNQVTDERITVMRGDIGKLTSLSDGAFDRVCCVSVLEHCQEPLTIITELWRLVKKGGRLLVTMDVASNRRHNHTIDEEAAKIILYPTFSDLPVMPDNPLINVFPEIEPKGWEHPNVLLRVLCFFKVKT